MGKDMSSAIRIGLDLGGTDLKAIALGPEDRVLHFTRVPSRAGEGAEGPIDAMRAAFAEVSAATDGSGRSSNPLRVGLGCPGAIDPETGALRGPTPHLPHWNGFPLASRAQAALGHPVHVENDATCAAWAEHRLGAARDTRVSITVTIGTGVGCGIVIDGRPFRGAHGGAGEIGHLPLGPAGSECACGVEGCAEPWMSGDGLADAARASGLGPVTASEIFALAARGNHVARSMVERLADRLGAALASAVHILDPEVIVLGGGVSSAGPPLIDAVTRALDRYVMRSHRAGFRLELAALGERAGAIGAALLTE